MKKKIRNIGSSTGIIFNSEERELYGLTAGSVIEFKDFGVHIGGVGHGKKTGNV